MQGYEHAKRATLAFLDTFKEKADPDDRELLRCVARTSLRTKLYEDLADQLTDIVVDAVLTIRKPEEAIDLFMVRFPRSHQLSWVLDNLEARTQSFAASDCLENNNHTACGQAPPAEPCRWLASQEH